jgi:ectoine hydroxylase-related dioxygenase (phytanoyl-CoA dioxygenase family)
MKAPTAEVTLSREDVDTYDRQGYLVVRELLSHDEVSAVRDRFDDIGRRGEAIPDYWSPDLSAAGRLDPLKRYPRVMMPHRYDALSRSLLLDQRIHNVVAALLRDEPLAAQSMFYFKPPGARGQALHQDNFYLQVQPGTCMAAWIAIDSSTPENGGLQVVPGTHKLGILCPEKADAGDSFTNELVQPGAGIKPLPLRLAPGDALFFNGSLIHGSFPNRSAKEWRRAFICHYIPGTTSKACSHWYFPLLNFKGEVVQHEASAAGGPCGTVDWEKFGA